MVMQASSSEMATLPADWTRAQSVFAVSIFPVVMTCAIGGCILLLESGFNPTVAFLATLLPSYAAVIAGERLFPHVPSWNRSHDDVGTDSAHFMSIIASNTVFSPGVALLGAVLGAWLATLAGATLWPTTWPLIGQLALALVIGELATYWVHRFQHEWPLLWRLHATHHSANRLYWLNAARFHFLDILMNTIVAVLPLIVLGASPEVFILVALFSTVHGIFQHANMKLRLGPLNWIFSMAELHRWHHSRLMEESNTNYGQNLSVWDTVFGTRYLPKDREPPDDVGLTWPTSFPMTFGAQVLAPIRWKRIVNDPGE
jgi:sterol desaturase/sphingolipid hydroxylase (fatty acid hydroxylase superfamily)